MLTATICAPASASQGKIGSGGPGSTSGHIGHLERLLAASRARLATASVSTPGMTSMPFRWEIDDLFRRQWALEADLRLAKRAIQRGDNLGWLLPVIAGGAALLSIIGAKVFQQHRATEEVEGRMEIYDRLIEAGYSAEDAGRLAFGDGDGIGGVMTKLIILSAIGAGVFVLFKLGPK